MKPLILLLALLLPMLFSSGCASYSIGKLTRQSSLDHPVKAFDVAEALANIPEGYDLRVASDLESVGGETEQTELDATQLALKNQMDAMKAIAEASGNDKVIAAVKAFQEIGLKNRKKRFEVSVTRSAATPGESATVALAAAHTDQVLKAGKRTINSTSNGIIDASIDPEVVKTITEAKIAMAKLDKELAIAELERAKAQAELQNAKPLTPSSSTNPPQNNHVPPVDVEKLDAVSVLYKQSEKGADQSVFVIDARLLGKIASVSIGSSEYANATNYKELHNGGREHWRKTESASSNDGKAYQIKLKTGEVYTGQIKRHGDQSKGYRADGMKARKTSSSSPPPSTTSTNAATGKHQIVFADGFAHVSTYIADLERRSNNWLAGKEANKGQGPISNLLLEQPGPVRHVFVRTDSPTVYQVPNTALPGTVGDFKIRLPNKSHTHLRNVTIPAVGQIDLAQSSFLSDTPPYSRVNPIAGWN